jgi:hypothetical protein
MMTSQTVLKIMIEEIQDDSRYTARANNQIKQGTHHPYRSGFSTPTMEASMHHHAHI